MTSPVFDRSSRTQGFVVLLLFFLLILAGGGGLTFYSASLIKTQLNIQAILYGLVRLAPEGRDTQQLFTDYFKGNLEPEILKQAAAAAAQTGFDPAGFFPMDAATLRRIRHLILFFAFWSTALTIFFSVVLIRIFARRQMVYASLITVLEKMLTEQPVPILPPDRLRGTSGDMEQILFDRFNQAARKQSDDIHRLTREKKRLKELVSALSHQLKTPLASLRLLNDLQLQEENPLNPEFLKKTEGQLDRMEWVIAKMLQIARLQTGSIQLKRERSDLSRSVTRVVADLESLARRKSVSVCVEADVVQPISFDSAWVEEAITNILENGIKYTPENSTVIVRSGHSGGYVFVSVTDQGPGIPGEEIPRVFEEFWRGSLNGIRDGNHSHPAGFGLGLSLAKTIVELHGGFIDVSNGRPPDGACFQVYLPEALSCP